jgi:hypothetical protein
MRGYRASPKLAVSDLKIRLYQTPKRCPCMQDFLTEYDIL